MAPSTGEPGWRRAMRRRGSRAVASAARARHCFPARAVDTVSARSATPWLTCSLPCTAGCRHCGSQIFGDADGCSRAERVREWMNCSRTASATTDRSSRSPANSAVTRKAAGGWETATMRRPAQPATTRFRTGRNARSGAPRPRVGAFGLRGRAKLCARTTPNLVEFVPRLFPVQEPPLTRETRSLAGLLVIGETGFEPATARPQPERSRRTRCHSAA